MFVICVYFTAYKQGIEMWFALAFFTLVACVEAINNITQCSTGCNCQETSSSLTVDCTQRPAVVDVKQLSNELDAILSSDHMQVNHLTSLSIINTSLTHVPASACKLVNLTSVNFNDNKFTELPENCFTKLTKLVTLSISRNAIVGLQDGVFDGLQSLVSLDLSYNQIAFIGLRVFSNPADLTSLRSLNLDGNRLTSLEPWWYYRCILGSETTPVRISLSHNLISNFTNKRQFEFRCGMKRPYGYFDLSGNRIRHIMDMFTGWNMVDRSLFTTITCLAISDTSTNMHFNLGGIPYVCDCTDIWFHTFRLLTWTWDMDDIHCYEPLSMFWLSVSRIPLNEFVCELTDRCPSGCRCVYRPANATLHIYCSAANLSSLPLDLPPPPKSYVRYKLDFSNNKLLRRLEHRPYFVNTSILDVSNCSIIYVAVGVLKDLPRLSIINLRGNMLQTFPRDADAVNISITRLLIGNNPWRCSCDNSWMIGWLQSLSDQISDPGDITCASPSRMYGRLLMKSTVEDFCVDPVKRVLTIIIFAVSSVVFVVFLLTIMSIMVYKLRVKYFRRWNFHPFDRDECVGEDMDYDVFLCCSSDDHNPHGLRILREMESSGYRVCYHLRDFLAGAPITVNMIQSIERSKRTVCLVSENFLRRLCITLFRYFSFGLITNI